MSGLRRSTRSTTSTINVKLNEQNEIEYFKVENDGEDGDDGAEDEIINGDVDVPNDMLELDDDDDHDNDDGNEEQGEEEEEEEEEELIANPDGTMSIKIAEKKPKKAKVPVHLICAKCSKVLSSGPVSQLDRTAKIKATEKQPKIKSRFMYFTHRH